MIEEEVTVYSSCGDPNDTIYDHKIKLRYFKVTDSIELHIDDVLVLFQKFNNIVYPRHEQN